MVVMKLSKMLSKTIEPKTNSHPEVEVDQRIEALHKAVANYVIEKFRGKKVPDFYCCNRTKFMFIMQNPGPRARKADFGLDVVSNTASRRPELMKWLLKNPAFVKITEMLPDCLKINIGGEYLSSDISHGLPRRHLLKDFFFTDVTNFDSESGDQEVTKEYRKPFWTSTLHELIFFCQPRVIIVCGSYPWHVIRGFGVRRVGSGITSAIPTGINKAMGKTFTITNCKGKPIAIVPTKHISTINRFTARDYNKIKSSLKQARNYI